MRRPLVLLCVAGLLAACGEEAPVSAPVPAGYERPAFDADGGLTGVYGVSAQQWAQVDPDFRKALFWQIFLDRLVERCRLLFPEHDAWLAEFSGLVRRGTGVAVDQGLAFERARLQGIGGGAENAVAGLEAMRVASMDVEGLLLGWFRAQGPGNLDRRTALVAGCDLVFARDDRRDLLRTVAMPLLQYFARLAVDHPAIRAGAPDIDELTRRLEKL